MGTKIKNAQLIDEEHVADADRLKFILLRYFKDIGTNIIKIEGELPVGLDSEILLTLLYNDGKGVWFKDENLGELFLPMISSNQYNIYGRPTKYGAAGFGGYTWTNLTPENSVILKNTKSATSTRLYIETMVDKLVNISQAIDVNVNAIKTPFVFEGEKDELLSMKNYFKKVNGNAPVIYMNKTRLETDMGLKVNDTQATYHGAELCDLYNHYMCLILTYLGINNSNIDKKERTNLAEVNANNEIIDDSLQMRLDSINEGLEKINKMFNRNLKATVNTELLDRLTDTYNSYKEDDYDE